jgi:hypothetical protein
MHTHLIDLETFGTWNDNFSLFLRRRCERICEELNTRIINREGEGHQQQVELNDVEPVET